MELDFGLIGPRNCYKMLVSVVVPRPIAWVTSQNAADQLNAAPFSFFNAMAGNPPLVALGINDLSPGLPKHTARNIAETKEFVINFVTSELAHQMNITAVEFPDGISEVDAARLATSSSVKVRPPRLTASPVSLECRERTTVEVDGARVLIAQVVYMHIRDDLIDAEKMHVDTPKLDAVGRMHGAGWYTTTENLFQIPRLSFEEWQALESQE